MTTLDLESATLLEIERLEDDARLDHYEKLREQYEQARNKAQILMDGCDLIIQEIHKKRMSS